jgi:hypothetical protein
MKRRKGKREITLRPGDGLSLSRQGFRFNAEGDASSVAIQSFSLRR